MNDDKKLAIIDLSRNLSLVLQDIVDKQQTKKDKNIQKILESQSFDELEILKYLGDFFKITPSNYKIIQQNCQYFPTLQKACALYDEIMESTDIEQQNFVNILILDHLSTTINETNVYLYSIYANLFLVDIDIYSFYQIVFMHCFGLPNSIYQLSMFVKMCNDIHDNRQILREFFLDQKKEFEKSHKWEIGTFGYFLHRFELIEKSDLINYYEYQFIHEMNDKVFLNDTFYDSLKNRTFSDTLLKLIEKDDVENFGRYVSTNHIDLNKTISKQVDISNRHVDGYNIIVFACVNDIIYWPFGQMKKIKMICFCAFLGSLKVFKYMVMNHANIQSDLINYAIAGGNLEIVHTCQQLECEINLSSIEFAIRYFRNEILVWLADNHPNLIQENLRHIVEYAIKYCNPQAFLVFYQNSFENKEVFLDHLNLVNREWLRFFISHDDLIHRFLDLNVKQCVVNFFKKANFEFLKIWVDELHDQIDLNINQIWESFDHSEKAFKKSLCSIRYFFDKKGELDQYKNELILPPFPNHFIKNIIIKKWGNSVFISFDTSLLIFLLKNKILKYEIILELSNLYYYSIKHFDKYHNVLEILERKDSLFIKSAQVYILTSNWLDFLYNEDKNIKSFYFDKCLLDCEFNSELQTELLHWACFFGDHFTVERLLLRKFVDVNSTKSKNGRTPLSLASQSNFFEIVYALINDERVDVNSFSEDHETPLYSAVECNFIEIVDLLLKNKKVDVNIPDKDGKTPFLVACERGYDRIVRKMLLRCDLDLNAMCKDGSPFGLAVENWQIKIVKLLMNENRIKFENENEKNPLQRACYNGNLEMVKILFSIESINKNKIDDVFQFNFF